MIRPDRKTRVLGLLGSAWLLVLAAGAHAAVPLPGDLDGDGSIGPSDETLLKGLWGYSSSQPGYEPAADLNADGVVNYQDLALFGAAYGASGGQVDTSPPGLLVTLDDIPDDMNDLLVVPPSGFQITLELSSAGGSAIDVGSLSVTSSEAVGAAPPGAELADLFDVSPTRAVFEVPAESALSLTSHYLNVSIRDAAGNQTSAAYGFAVRDFAYGAPMGTLQTIFLDFDQNRSLGPDLDFVEDLRKYGLSTAAAPAIEQLMRDRMKGEIVARVHPYYGRSANGSPGPDAVNVLFTAANPGGAYSRICVGGQSALGATYLGASTMDLNNLNKTSDECGPSNLYGVFPQGIGNLWGGSGEYQSAFYPLMAEHGGVPVGADPLDATVTSPSFDPGSGSQAELARYWVIENGIDAFSQVVATLVAHETGHLFGLVPHGPAPGGLWGGDTGAKTDHNVTTSGAVPSQNYVMNQGSSFSFQEMAGRGGLPLPVFRTINWAYLHDRIALNTQVTALLPPPQLTSVTPNPVSYPAGQQSVSVTLHGADLAATPLVHLIRAGDPTPDALLNVTFVNPSTITGTLNKFIHPAATYDVRLTNPDGQVVTLSAGLTVQ